LVTLTIDGRPIDLGQVSEKVRKAAIGRFFFNFNNGKLNLRGSIRLAKLRGNKPQFFDQAISSDNGHGFFRFLKTKPGTESLRLSADKTHYIDFDYAFDLETLGDAETIPAPNEPQKRVPADPGPFSGEIDEFLLRPDEDSTKLGGFTNSTELRSIVKQQAGIKIFRDGFGIKPYGINAQDWLKMGQGQSSGGSYYGLRPDNVLGFVLISEAQNSHLKEKTDREGFVSNAWSQNFQRLVSLVPKTVSDLYETIRRTQLLYEQEVVEKEHPYSGTGEALADADTVAKRLSSYTAKGLAFRQKTEATRAKLHEVSERISKTPIFSGAAEREAADLIAEAKGALDASTSLVLELEQYTADARALAGIVASLAPRLEVLREQLNDYSELAGLGLLAEALSHEVQNQTDRLMLQASAAAKKGKEARPPNRDMVQFARDVTSTVSVLRTLVAHLGPSLRYQRDRVEIIEVSSLLKEVRAHFLMRWESNHFECKFILTGSDFDIEINRGRIVQVIDNLLLNSEYWLKESLGRDGEFKPQITIDYEPYRLRIWDNGPGIDQSVEATLFEPFVTRKPKTQGRGLGLYITAQIMDSFGGGVTLLHDRNSFGRRYIFELDLTSIGHG
jgi:signal transduction histidine kinase